MTDPAHWGVSTRYQDLRREWREVPQDTIDALLAAMGAQDEAGPPGSGDEPPVRVVAAGEAVPVPGRWRVRTEDGAELAGKDRLPADLPLGYHVLHGEDGGRAVRLIVTPGTCLLPEGLRTWGWAVQLPATRSRDSWGIGDLGDLGRLARWSAGRGAGMCLVSPLHAPLPTAEQQPSPYSPSSRCYRNPLYLRVEDVPGAAAAAMSTAGVDLATVAAAGRALNLDRRIDRDAVWRLKLSALEAIWAATASGAGDGDDPDFTRYCEAEAGALAGYATFCALVEEHGVPWSSWPADLRHPDGPGVLAFVDAHRGRIRFHQWLQWLIDRQLAAAGTHLGLVHDLAIGVDPDGADAWLWQDCFIRGVRVGAPGDQFNRVGQDWGVAPLDPWKLRAAAYEPFIRTIRAGFRHAGGMRVDHVMGLFRLFWIPEGGTAAAGTYVRYPSSDLLGILALESHRAGAYVVGEDLGNVENSVREELGRRRVLSYRLLWFEDGPPKTFPAQALAAATTHDLPTVAGLWSGDDLAEQQRIGLAPDVDATREVRARVGDWAGVDDAAPVAEVVSAVYRLLAEAPSAVVTATLEDALAVPERPNVPGTTDERPNWSLALPCPLEELETHPLAGAVAAALAGRGATMP